MSCYLLNPNSSLHFMGLHLYYQNSFPTFPTFPAIMMSCRSSRPVPSTLIIQFSFLSSSLCPILDFRLVSVLSFVVLSAYGRCNSIPSTLHAWSLLQLSQSKALPFLAFQVCIFQVLFSFKIHVLSLLRQSTICSCLLCPEAIDGIRFSGTSNTPWVTEANILLALTSLQTHSLLRPGWNFKQNFPYNGRKIRQL